MTESEIVKFLHSLPAAGSRVKVTYNCEYNGMEPAAREDSKKKSNNAFRTWTRQAVVKQKIYNGAQSTIVLEIQPEQVFGKQGRYCVAFRMGEIMTGAVKLEEIT